MRAFNRILLSLVFAGGLVAGTASATTVDLTAGAGTSGEIDGAQFFFGSIGSGTGAYMPIVRMRGGDGTEEGYNTSGRPPAFEELIDPNFTRDITLEEIPTVELGGTTFLVFDLDVNEPGNPAGALISLDALQIYSSAIGSQTTSDIASLGTLHYDMDALADSVVLMDARNATGSGTSDMVMLVPISLFAGVSPTDFIYLYSRFGDTEAATSGFEEWRLTATSVPEPQGLMLLSMGLVGLGVWRPRQG